MDWLVGLLLLVVGAVFGYFVAKYFNDQEKQRQQGDEKEQTVKEIMAQEAVQHIHQSKKIVQQINQQAEQLAEQMASYEQSIIAHNSGADDAQLNYFGEHATTYLRNKSESPTHEKAKANVQPLDFSSESSGLFKGSIDSEVKEVK